MTNYNEERVHQVRNWTESLFSFTTTRDRSFRFESGQFTMLGLSIGRRPLLRAYSMVSAIYDDHLEFLSIKVPNGPLTSRLQHLSPGDRLLIGRKPTGTLVLGTLLPGRRLYLLGTGTGIAPFLSLIKDPGTYESFEQVILVHGCRTAAELVYADEIEELPRSLSEIVNGKLRYFPTVTREPFRSRGRITHLLDEGTLPTALDLPPLNPEEDRIMVCGGPSMLHDVTEWFRRRQFIDGSHSRPGHITLEKAFAEP